MEILMRRCPTDLNLKEFKIDLQRRVRASKEYKGYRVFNVALNNFVELWNAQTTYTESMKDLCFVSCEQGRLFALLPE